VRVHVEEVPMDPGWRGRDYVADAAFRDGFQATVRDLWACKDARISVMLSPGATATRQ